MRAMGRRAMRAEYRDAARFEAVEPRLLLASVPMAVADAADRVEVVHTDGGGLLVYVEGEGGQWGRKDLGGWIPEALRAGFAPNSSAAWLDPKDGRSYYAFNAPGALALILDDDRGRIESVRVLSQELAGAEPIASRITSFTSTDGLVHIAGATASGDVVVYRQTGGRSPSGAFEWEFVNLSADHLAPQGQATPVFASGLVSYVTAWNGLNIAGLDENGDVRAVWWAPGLDRWQSSNLSEQTGAPTMTGGLSVYLTAWDGINIAGANPDGELVVTWWVPQFGGDWALTNFTESFSGPRLTPGTVMAYTTPWGGLNVGGADADGGGLAIYWWVPQFQGRWEVAGDLVPGAEAFGGGVYGFTSGAGTINLVGVSAGGEVIRYAWRPGEQWRFENIGASATPVVDVLDDDDVGPLIPHLEPLSGSWLVTLRGGLFDAGEDDDPDTGRMVLRADGTWFSGEEGGGGLDLAGLGASDLSGGTWTYSGGAVTLTIPEFGYTRATGVSAHASGFTTRGVILTPDAVQRMEDALEELQAQFPGLGLLEQIRALGGIEKIFREVEILWTRAP